MNKTFVKSGLSKKEIIDKFKIAVFEKDSDLTLVYSAELLCSGHIKLLIQTCIELWAKFYILSYEIPLMIINCINITKDINSKDIYKYNDIRFEIIKLCLTICKTEKKQLDLYTSKVQKNEIHHIKNKNDISTFYYNLVNSIQSYIDEEGIIYFYTLLYKFYTKKVKEFNIVLSYIIDNYVKKKELKRELEVLNLSRNYIWLLIKILKQIYSNLNDNLLYKYYENYIYLFEYNINKTDIINRINIIYVLFDIIIDSNVLYYLTNQQPILNTINIDINYIDSIFGKLIDYYELDVNIKDDTKKYSQKKKYKKNKYSENSYNTENLDENTENIENDPADYLYTFTYIDKKKFFKKKNDLNIPRIFPIKTIDVEDYNENKININISKLI